MNLSPRFPLIAALVFGIQTITIGQVAVQNGTMNILHYGISSPLLIVSQEPIDTIQLQCAFFKTWNRLSDRSIECEITASPDPSHKAVQLATIGLDGAVLDEHHFRIKTPTAPTVAVAGAVDGDTLPKTALLGTPGISARLEGFDLDVRVAISGFRLTMTDAASQQAKLVKINGNKFPENVRNEIQDLPHGSILTFDQIQCVLGEGFVYPTSLSFKVYLD